VTTESDTRHPDFPLKRRGYDCDAVDSHLVRLAAAHAQVRRERDELNARIATLEGQLEHYRGLEQRIVSALLLAERAAADTAERAAEQAEQTHEAAAARADEIVRDAMHEHQQLLRDVERLRGLRADLISSYRGFLLAALDAVAEYSEADTPAADQEILEPHPVVTE